MIPFASIPVLALLSLAAVAPLQQPTDCPDWETCRALAMEARAGGDFERFHDLAWRAVQRRGRRDPELMFLLARAQSLSGRPHDALVMLKRLAELGETFDALTSEDLARTRSLPEWPDTATLLERAAAPPPLPAPAETPAAPAPAVPAPPPSRPGATAVPIAESDVVARFAIPSLASGGMAYDAVSRRFIVGNVPARKLTVVGEGTNRPATYAGDAAALFDVRALQIDRSNGDLWVVSDDCGRTDACRSALHKLNLISGRVLTVFEPPTQPSRLVDVSVAGADVLVLDATGPRIVRVESRTGTMTGTIDLPAGEATSLASSGRAVYVAYADRIVRVDLGSRAAAMVNGSEKSGAGLERIRWHEGSIIGLRPEAPGSPGQIARIRLTRDGQRVVSSAPLARVPEGESLLAMDIAGDQLYYLTRASGPQVAIHAIRLP